MPLYAFGDDRECQLGNEQVTTFHGKRCYPAPRTADTANAHANLTHVCSGGGHSLALDELGQTYTWGRTREGQCGSLSTAPLAKLKRLDALAHEHITAVACGHDASYAMTAGGALYQFGCVHEESSSLAHANLAGYGRNLSELSEESQQMLRSSLESFLAGDLEANADNDGHTDGDENVDGNSNGGVSQASEVGTKRTLRPDPVRVHLPQGERASGVAGGYGFAVVALASGGAVTFGLNDRFQLGISHRKTQSVPQRVAGLGRRKLVALACGQQHTCVIDETGVCLSWGLGSFGQLGHGCRRDEPKPRVITALQEAGTAYAVACGQQHSIFLLRVDPSSADADVVAAADGGTALLGCGHAEYGQLGTGDVGGSGEVARDFPNPRRIELPSEVGELRAVACGALHSVVLTTRGEVLTFGWGAAGALGHGSFNYELQARRVEELGLRRVTCVAAGAKFTAVLEGDVSSGLSALSRDLGALLHSGRDTDCTLLAGRGPGARRFLAHAAVLSCRCPRLMAMFAFSTSRFLRPSDPVLPPPPLHWQSQAHGEEALAAPTEETGHDGIAHPPRGAMRRSCAFRQIRAPIFALVLTWIYTGRLETVERLFLKQIRSAARLLGLADLADECERAQRSSSDGHDDTTMTTTPNDLAPSGSHGLRARLAGLLGQDGCYAVEDLELVAMDGTMRASRALLCARVEYFGTCLQSSFLEGQRAQPRIDLRQFGIAIAELNLLLQYIYTGSVDGDSVERPRVPEGGAVALDLMEPSMAATLMPHASALLMEDLKRLCEVSLVSVCDEDNAEGLKDLAENCFAQQLLATCNDFLVSGEREPQH